MDFEVLSVVANHRRTTWQGPGEIGNFDRQIVRTVVGVAKQ